MLRTRSYKEIEDFLGMILFRTILNYYVTIALGLVTIY